MLTQYRDFDAKNIFKTFNSHPAYDGRLNGLDVFIMQSDENLQKVLERATYLIYTFNTDRESAIRVALEQYDLSIDEDFTDPDKKKILDWI